MECDVNRGLIRLHEGYKGLKDHHRTLIGLQYDYAPLPKTKLDSQAVAESRRNNLKQT